jgi:hypothetical protein
MIDNNKCSDKYKEYTYNKDALEEMFNLQIELQEFMNKKYGTVSPNSNHSTKEKIEASLYFFNCLAGEFYELKDALYKYHKCDNKQDLKDLKLEYEMEIIDIFFFMMNCFVYIDSKKLIPTKNIDYFYENKNPFINSSTYEFDFNDFSDMILTIWGQFVNNIPFKRWKTYKNIDDDIKNNIKKLKSIQENMLFIFFSLCKYFNISKEHLYNLYKSKWEENINRQKENGVYA